MEHGVFRVIELLKKCRRIVNGGELKTAVNSKRRLKVPRRIVDDPSFAVTLLRQFFVHSHLFVVLYTSSQ